MDYFDPGKIKIFAIIMEDIITAFLVQSKECSLPGIGNFRLITVPAEHDMANKVIYPPDGKIIFNRKANKLSEELVTYFCFKENVDPEVAAEKIKNWCEIATARLSAGEKIIFEAIGNLQADSSGNISFQAQKRFPFLQAVPVERVISKTPEHPVLIGDNETTSTAVNRSLQEVEVVKNFRWKIIAAFLLAAGLITLFIYFYNHGFSLAAAGNQMQHVPETPAATYSTQ